MESSNTISYKNRNYLKWIVSMLCLLLSVNLLCAQIDKVGVSMFLEDKSSIDFGFKTRITSQLKLLVAPQFGGLFDAQFKYVEGIANLRKLYDNFDFSFTIGPQFDLVKGLVCHVVYNMGLVKLGYGSSNKIPGTCIRLGIKYNF